MTCPHCPATFESNHALHGHIGAAHVRKRVLGEIEHGTTNGYRAHKRRKEHACAECLLAWRQKYQRRLKN